MLLNRNAARFWIALVGALGLTDYALAMRRDGSSFSEWLRWLFRTNTTGGRLTFVTLLAVAAVGFAVHILYRKGPLV